MTENGNTKEPEDSWGLGNKLLYDCCREYRLDAQNGPFSVREILASQLWLIGRSYAASPERYRYRAGVAKPADLDDDGYEPFFTEIANILCSQTSELHEHWDLFVAELYENNEFLKEAYSFEGDQDEINENDERKLLHSICLVFLFLGVLRKARFTRDQNIVKKDGNLGISKPRGNNAQISKARQDKIDANVSFHKELSKLENPDSEDCLDQSYPLSFCSKFLHFHAPHTVFIYDSVTKSHLTKRHLESLGLTAHEAKRVRKIARELTRKMIEDDRIKKAFTGYPESSLKDEETQGSDKANGKLYCKMLEYTTHCVMEYTIIKKHRCKNYFQGKPVDYFPRWVDDFVTNKGEVGIQNT